MGRNTSNSSGGKSAIERVAKVLEKRASKRRRSASSHPTFLEEGILESINTMAPTRDLPQRVNPLMTEEVPSCKTRQFGYGIDLTDGK